MTFLGIFLVVVGLCFVVALVMAQRRHAELRRTGVLPPEGQGSMADVERLVRAGQKIEAIRVYREIHPGVGLAEAKKAVKELPLRD